MSSPFQKGFIEKSPIDKKAVGKQNRLPEELKAKILAAPEDSPVKKEKDPRERVKDTIRVSNKYKPGDYVEEFELEESVKKQTGKYPQLSAQDYSKVKKDKKGNYITKL
jgi:hypothetical protein